MIVFAAVEFGDEIFCGFNVGHQGVLELANLCFIGISAIKEDDFISALGDKFVHFFWSEMGSIANNTILIDLNLISGAKSDQLITNFDAESREFISSSIRPFEINLLETWILFGLLHIFLQGIHIATKSSIDPMFGDQNSSS